MSASKAFTQDFIIKPDSGLISLAKNVRGCVSTRMSMRVQAARLELDDLELLRRVLAEHRARLTKARADAQRRRREQFDLLDRADALGAALEVGEDLEDALRIGGDGGGALNG
jgi:predicted RNA-binding Zn ribbon-like protein